MHPVNPIRTRIASTTLLCAITFVLAGCATLFPPVDDLKLTVVSPPSQQVVGGDSALVKINGSVLPIARLQVMLNGQDVTSNFTRHPADGKLTGLVSGLLLGKNTLTARTQLPGDTYDSGYSLLELTHPPR
jgi:Tannase-like family of unknown function (DUF6351)